MEVCAGIALFAEADRHCVAILLTQVTEKEMV
jgi:hypothetical protein